MIYQVTLQHNPDETFVAECPALPGCVSRGRDELEALANLKEAITAWTWSPEHLNAAEGSIRLPQSVAGR